MVSLQCVRSSRLILVSIFMIGQVLLPTAVSRGKVPDGPETFPPVRGGDRCRLALSTQSISYPNFSNISQHSLKLDASGYYNIAFGGDHLYFASYNGTSWTQQAVDQAWGVGKGAAWRWTAAGRRISVITIC